MKKLFVLGLMMAATVSVSAANRNEHDDDWVDAMILHHTQSISMARTVAASGADQKLQAAANSMIDAMQKEIELLQPLRDSGEEPNRAELQLIDGMASSAATDLTGKEGAALDRAFVDAMAAHQKAAVTIARAEIRSGSDMEARQLAVRIANRSISDAKALDHWKPSKSKA